MLSVLVYYVAHELRLASSIRSALLSSVMILGLTLGQGGCLDTQRRATQDTHTTLESPAHENHVSRSGSFAQEAPSEWTYMPPKDQMGITASEEDLTSNLVREISRVSHHRTAPTIMRFRELLSLGDDACPSLTREEEEGKLTFVIEDFCETNNGVQFEGRLTYEEINEREEGVRVTYISVYGDRFKVIYPDGSALTLTGTREMSREVSDDEEIKSALSEGLLRYTPASHLDSDSTSHNGEDHREPIMTSEWDQRSDPFELRHEISHDQEGVLTLSIEGSWRVSQSDDSGEALTAIAFDQLELHSDAECPLTIRGTTEIRGRDGRWSTLVFGTRLYNEDSGDVEEVEEGEEVEYPESEEVERPESLSGDVDGDELTTSTDAQRCDPCGQIITPDAEARPVCINAQERDQLRATMQAISSQSVRL